jgi:hypothetical protein
MDSASVSTATPTNSMSLVLLGDNRLDAHVQISRVDVTKSESNVGCFPCAKPVYKVTTTRPPSFTVFSP